MCDTQLEPEVHPSEVSSLTLSVSYLQCQVLHHTVRSIHVLDNYATHSVEHAELNCAYHVVAR